MFFTDKYINNIRTMVRFIVKIIEQEKHGNEKAHNVLYNGYANRYSYVLQRYDNDMELDVYDLNNLLSVGNAYDCYLVDKIINYANQNPKFAEILGMEV